MANIQEDIRIYGFNTNEKDYAIASQIIYSIYRSRDQKKFSAKASRSYWGATEGFIKKSARGSATIIRFIEKFKKEMEAKTIYPMFMDTKLLPFKTQLLDSNGNICFPKRPEVTTYLTEIIKNIDNRRILNILLEETAYIIMLVRERIDIEKELENNGYNVLSSNSLELENLNLEEK